MKMFTTFTLTLWLASSLGGCARSDSSQIEATAFFGTLRLEGDSAATVTCRATWQVGGSTGTYIEMKGTDRTTCSDGTSEVALTEDASILGQVRYSTSSVPYRPGSTYTFTLYKDDKSYVSTVLLPESIAFTAPTIGQVVTKGSALNVKWNAGSANKVSLRLGWTAPGQTGSQTEDTTDSGDFTAPVTFTQTIGLASTPVSGNVSATLTLTRIRYGSFVAAGLEGGSIEATQEKSVTGLTLVD